MPLTAVVLKELIDYNQNIIKIIPSDLSYEDAQLRLGNLITNSTTSYSASPQVFNLLVDFDPLGNGTRYWSTPTLAIPSVTHCLSTVSNDKPILFVVKPGSYVRTLFLCNEDRIVGVLEMDSVVSGSTTGMPVYIPSLVLKGE